ncbi:AraC family transcriptional regulator [Rhizobium leguminosarum]|uniref:AraC family transcriptional regulator n=1 Tax=Rhizobium leguminosarum TaxID=384 RepID=UPI0021B0EFB9|nr:AraC family transcriptional regulator [Rhizobium leguminosarum]
MRAFGGVVAARPACVATSDVAAPTSKVFENVRLFIIHRPALCIVVQGAKWTTFGERRLHYRTSQAMVVSVEMPGASQVVHGAPDAPYLSAVIELDQAILREVSMEAPPTPASDEHAAAFVMELNEAILGCAARAVSLLGEPQAIPLLYPGVKRELCYRLLAGPHGGVFARMAVGAERNRRLKYLQTGGIAHASERAKISCINDKIGHLYTSDEIIISFIPIYRRDKYTGDFPLYAPFM